MIETLAPLGEAHLGFASIGGSDAATILLITHESVVTYLHGGSAKVHREVMAPFLLHWQAIQWAKQADYKVYDFWGTNAVQKDDTWEPLPNHASTGTTRFKLGFGGEVVQFPGAVDLVLKPIPYTLYRTMRRIIRRQSSF
jgi:lipid II:glycine glycyltransferase (peptidoglycan interpeptide bridge formation enzyme)